MQSKTSFLRAAEPRIQIRSSPFDEAGRILEIWRYSVAAPHHRARLLYQRQLAALRDRKEPFDTHR